MTLPAKKQKSLKHKMEIVSTIAIVIALVLLTFWILGGQERLAESQKELDEATMEMDRIVNKAIVHCETDGLGCNEIIPEWLEKCNDPEMKDVPSCHDGRIERLMESRVVKMSHECHLRLAEIQNNKEDIYGNFDEFAYQDSIYYFEELCGKYDTLLEGSIKP